MEPVLVESARGPVRKLAAFHSVGNAPPRPLKVQVACDDAPAAAGGETPKLVTFRLRVVDSYCDPSVFDAVKRRPELIPATVLPEARAKVIKTLAAVAHGSDATCLVRVKQTDQAAVAAACTMAGAVLAPHRFKKQHTGSQTKIVRTLSKEKECKK